jgi:putative peptide zinc metalloprotease protein
MFRPQVVISTLGLIVCLEIWIGFNLKSISGQAVGGSKSASGWFLFMCTLLVSALCHEMAHGLACKYFGGRVNDMGIMWRYLWFYPYCNLDHTMFFRNRWHQVFVAFAGIYMNLLILLPFALVWRLSPPETLLHTLSIKMLLWFNVMTFLNLIPFIQLDGYYMLSHALGMSELRKESHRYLWKAVKRIIHRSNEQAGNYRPMTRFIYSVYGFISLLVSGALIIMMLGFWYRMLVARFASSNFMLAGIFIMIILARYGLRWVIKINQWLRGQAVPLTER